MKLTTSDRGFVALISVIIIALVLMLVATSLSFSGYYTRFNTLDKELKERSVALAESCVEVARLRLAKDSGYKPSNAGDEVSVEGDTCTIVCVSPKMECISQNSSEKVIQAEAHYREYQTYLEVKVNISSLAIVSWREVANF